MPAMSYAEACETALRMSNQKIKAKDIHAHLKAQGYSGPRSGEMPGLNMVYAMIRHEQKRLKLERGEDVKQEKRDAKVADKMEAVRLVNPNEELVMMLKSVTKNKDLPAQTRMKMIEMLIRNA